jgi:hypothetical protein
MREATLPEPGAVADAADTASRAERAAAFRRELFGTAAIVAAIAGIIVLGSAASALVGRSTAHLGPGVTVDFGPGWDEWWMGPTDILSSRRQYGEVELVVAPTFDGRPAEAALEGYRDDVIATEVDGVSFDPPEPRDHPAGTALGQAWRATGPDGSAIAGDLLAVVNGRTTVILDLRWLAGADEATLREPMAVVDSLAIEPLAP